MLYMLYTGLCIMCMGGNYHDYLAWVPRQFLRQVLSSFIQDFYFVTLLLPDVCFKWAISCILNHIEQEAWYTNLISSNRAKKNIFQRVLASSVSTMAIYKSNKRLFLLYHFIPFLRHARFYKNSISHVTSINFPHGSYKIYNIFMSLSQLLKDSCQILQLLLK